MNAALVISLACKLAFFLPTQARRVHVNKHRADEHYDARLQFARDILSSSTKGELKNLNGRASSKIAQQQPTNEQSLDEFLAGLDSQEASQPMMNPPQIMQREQYPQANRMSEEEALFTELEEVECEATKQEWEKWAFLCNQMRKGHLETGKTTGKESTEADVQIYVGDENMATNPNAYRDEIHEYHCRAARLNRARRSFSLIDKHMGLPNFPHVLGRFQIEGLLHDKEDGVFLKVVAKACGPCKFLGMHQRFDGLKEVDVNGFPKFTESIRYGSSTKTGKSYKVDPRAMYEYGTWVVTSKHFDEVILPELEDLASKMKNAREHAVVEGKTKFITPQQMLPDRAPYDGENFTEMPIKLEIQDLLKKIREQDEFIPFNHKAERVDFELYKCNYYKKGGWGKKATSNPSEGQLECHKKETLHLHDGQLIWDSAIEPTTDYLKPTHTTNAAASYTSMAQIKGLHFSKYHTEIKGPIDWEVTVPPAGHCSPMTSRYLYVGMGVDSDVDLDLGVVFWKLSSDGSRLSPHEYVNFQKGRGVKLGGLVEYSGDNRNGAGEGDDEFMVIDMNKLKTSGYEYVTVVVNIYNAGSFSDLEGAFLRFVSGTDKAFRTRSVETLHYLDLDEFSRGDLLGKRAAVGALLFARDPQNLGKAPPTDSELILPKASIQKLDHGGNDWHYQLAAVKHTCGGHTIQHSIADLKKWFESMSLPSKKEKLKDVPDMTKAELGQRSIIQALPDFQSESFVPNPVGVDQNDYRLQQASTRMSEHALAEAILVEFPSGPPGTDLLCYKGF